MSSLTKFTEIGSQPDKHLREDPIFWHCDQVILT
jgi:hypothetical protein